MGLLLSLGIIAFEQTVMRIAMLKKDKSSASKRQQNRTEELFRKWKATSDPDLRAQLLYSVQQFLGPMLRAKFGHFSNARSMEDIFAEVQKKILCKIVYIMAVIVIMISMLKVVMLILVEKVMLQRFQVFDY